MTKNRFLVLAYHRVLDAQDSLRPEQTFAKKFERHTIVLSKFFNVIDLSEVPAMLEANEIPPRAVAISFDDGYKDNFRTALPIIDKYKMTASFFVATAYLDGGIMWNDAIIEAIRHCKCAHIDFRIPGIDVLPTVSAPDKRATIVALIRHLKYLPSIARQEAVQCIVRKTGAELPKNLMMSSDNVAELHTAGMNIGAHTVHHPILSKISQDEARVEIVESKKHLESLLGASVSSFAFPNGKPGIDYLPEHVEIVRDAGFKLAVSTYHGRNDFSCDRFQIARISVWDNSKSAFLFRMLRNYFV